MFLNILFGLARSIDMQNWSYPSNPRLVSSRETRFHSRATSNIENQKRASLNCSILSSPLNSREAQFHTRSIRSKKNDSIQTKRWGYPTTMLSESIVGVGYEEETSSWDRRNRNDDDIPKPPIGRGRICKYDQDPDASFQGTRLSVNHVRNRSKHFAVGVEAWNSQGGTRGNRWVSPTSRISSSAVVIGRPRCGKNAGGYRFTM